MMTEQTKNSLSNFIKYCEGWDLHIESLDDFEDKEKMQKIIQEASNFLFAQTVEWEKKIIDEDLDVKKLSNPEKEEIYKKLENLRGNKKYQDFQRISNNLIWLRYRVDDLFEIKHRRTKENFDLRAEIAKSKLKS